MYCENSVEAYVLKIAIAKANLTCVPNNPMLAPDLIAYLIGQAEPRSTIVDAGLWPKASTAFAQQGMTPDVTIEIGGTAIAGSQTFAGFIESASRTEPEVE